ncbi:MAG: DNA polymerase III subunit delta [Acidimicrobiia bacterium]
MTIGYYVRGDDVVLRGEVLTQVLDGIVSHADRALAVEDFTVPGRSGTADGEGGGAEARDAVVGAAVVAAQSPPFMTPCRVVVVRDVGNLTTADAEPFVRYLADPLDTTIVVFVAGGGRVPANLAKAWKGVVEEVGPQSEKTVDVLVDHAKAAGLAFTADARQLVVDHLGEDAGRVPQLVDLLRSAFGEGAKLAADDVEPYLGEAGAIPVYQLTNAIEAGDVPGALEVLHRLLHVTGPQGKPMHPLQVLGLLHNQYRRLLALDDPAIRTEEDAVRALGGKVKPYPARKALEQARVLGTERLRQAFDALARADVELKGATAMPEDAVVDVLVARLTGLARRAKGRGPSRRSGAGRGPVGRLHQA